MSAKKTAMIFLNLIGVLVLGLLWVNFLYGPWYLNSNPVGWILFLRSGGPLLYGQHVASEVAVLLVATIFAAKYPSNAFRWIAVVFAGASIHELLVGLNIIIDFGSVSAYLSFVDPRWPVDLIAFLVVGILAATRWQKRVLSELFLIGAAYEIGWNILVRVFGFSAISLMGFAPGPAFWDWKENTLEVVSWILPSAWWLWRWRKSQQSFLPSVALNSKMPSTPSTTSPSK